MHWPTFAFWLGIPALLLILFALFRPKLALLTLPICLAADLLTYGPSYFYYESQGLLLLFTAAQAALTAILAAIIWRCAHKRRNKP